jgi:hypothetical protein
MRTFLLTVLASLAAVSRGAGSGWIVSDCWRPEAWKTSGRCSLSALQNERGDSRSLSVYVLLLELAGIPSEEIHQWAVGSPVRSECYRCAVWFEKAAED